MDKIDFKNPGVQKIALSTLLGVGLLAIFFFTHYLPFGYPRQQEALVSLRKEFDRKTGELQRAKQTVADLPRFEAEYGRLHDRWVQAAELLPEDRQVSVLLRKITLAAQQTGVEFVVFRPTDARTEQHYTELPLQLSVFGGYHQVGSFVAELANMRRIVTVSNLQIKANAKPEEPNATVSAEFTASAYSLNPGAAEAPPAEQPKEGGSRARKSS
jgi:type IV pilus assembly protein PilO